MPSTLNWTPAIPALLEAVAATVATDESVESRIGSVIDTAGAALLPTVTETAAEVVWLPAASRATAVSMWVPSATAAVFQDVEYGATVISAPKFALSNLNWTPTTPTSSEAVAETVVVAETVEPPAGPVTETVGGVV